MKFHLTLEYKRLCRLIESAGFNATRVIIVLFILISFLITFAISTGDKSFLALVFIALLSLSFSLRKSRVDFYSKIYPKSYWLKIQTAELVLLTSPFAILLLVLGNAAFAAAILAIALSVPLLLGLKKKSKFQLVLPPFPTPFKRYPFEYIRGFRMTWPLYTLPLFFFHKAVELSNPNFSVFAILVAVLIPGFYFSKPEPVSYLTIYKADSKMFLREKIIYVLKNTFLLSVPFILIGMYLFPNSLWLCLGALLFGLIFSVSAMLGKYAYFPNELNAVQSTSLILSLIMPPLLLAVLPAFYKKALTNLKQYLS